MMTRSHMPAGTIIGPFEGQVVQPENVTPGLDTSNLWEVCNVVDVSSRRYKDLISGIRVENHQFSLLVIEHFPQCSLGEPSLTSHLTIRPPPASLTF